MSKVGKITITVTRTANTQVMKVATTGSRGTVLLNDQNFTFTTPSQSPTTTSGAFWQDVLAKVSPQL